jgi:hypothetical protein
MNALNGFVFEVRQARSTLYVVRAASEKFGLHAGNMKLISTQ